MSKWILKQEEVYRVSEHDAYRVLDMVTFFSPADPESGVFYEDRELDLEEVVEILMRGDEVVKLMMEQARLMRKGV